MSYILEALKKLEQKRGREEGSRLLPEEHAGTLNARQPLWPYLLVSVLILNAGLIVWWLSPWQHVHKEGGSRIAVRGSSGIETFSAEEDRQSGRAVSSARAANPPREASAALQGSDQTMPAATVKEPKQHFAESPPRERGINQGQHTVDINELPQEQRQTLPDLTIAGHFFDAEPSSRIVIIGGRTLHEGQTVAPGLKLDQITRDGAIFNYQGTRFRKGVF